MRAELRWPEEEVYDVLLPLIEPKRPFIYVFDSAAEQSKTLAAEIFDLWHEIDLPAEPRPDLRLIRRLYVQ